MGELLQFIPRCNPEKNLILVLKNSVRVLPVECIESLIDGRIGLDEPDLEPVIREIIKQWLMDTLDD